MVKFLVKRAELDTEKRVIKLGYCQAQYLLKGLNPFAYTKGTYGWNADIYHFNDYYIVTGYRPFGKIEPKWQDVRKYELKAQKINQKYYMKTEQRNKELNKLLKNFIKNCCKL